MRPFDPRREESREKQEEQGQPVEGIRDVQQPAVPHGHDEKHDDNPRPHPQRLAQGKIPAPPPVSGPRTEHAEDAAPHQKQHAAEKDTVQLGDVILKN